MAAKRRLVQIKEVPHSEQPFRVLKKRTGVTLGSFDTTEAVQTFLAQVSLQSLSVKPKRKRSGG